MGSIHNPNLVTQTGRRWSENLEKMRGVRGKGGGEE